MSSHLQPMSWLVSDQPQISHYCSHYYYSDVFDIDDEGFVTDDYRHRLINLHDLEWDEGRFHRKC